MSADINEQVLAAFQAEHKEQLEGIRALLAQLTFDEPDESRDGIDEAFRLAHSLKGGARVCDLRPAEKLAHRLENVFEQVRGGTLCLDEDVVRTISVVLDAIEDWMAALDRDEQPADPNDALTAVERLVNSGDAGNAAMVQAPDDTARRLVDAFCREYPQYLAGLHRFAAAMDDGRSETSADVLNETYRLAHNLCASAHAADITSIAEAAQAVESLVAGFRDEASVPDAAAREALRQNLERLEVELGRLADGRGADGQRNPVTASEPQIHVSEAAGDAGLEAARPRTSGRNLETVRISTESLDRLLRSSRLLVTESGCQQQVNRELEEVRRQVHQLKRERDSIRRVVAASLHRLSTIPEFHRLSNYFETIDRGILSLTRRTRQLGAVQKRSAWMLQSRGRQVQQDVRHARMIPAEAVFQSLRKLVRDLAKEEGKLVEFCVAGFDVTADRMVFQALKDPLIHMLRNCIVHGVESPEERTAAGKTAACRIDLRIETVGSRLTIDVEDDGRGIDRERVTRCAIAGGLVSQTDIAEHPAKAAEGVLFHPGFSTSDQVTEIAGRGMGLSVVRDAVTRLQGEVRVCDKETAGTLFRIRVPLCVSTHRLLLVMAGNQTYAIPVHGIERLLRIKTDDMETIEGRPIVTFQDRPVPLVSLTGLLGLENNSLKVNGDAIPVAILKSGTQRVAVSVETLLAESDLLIQDLEGPAANKACLGAILLEEGTVALVLDPTHLVESARPASGKFVVEQAAPPAEKRMPRVLVVDDSLTTRTLEKSILEANGYEVGTAVDGMEGLNQLKAEHYDLVISDIEMPRMDGFTLLAEIKKDRRLASTPVIMVTSRARREDQEKGLDQGAEAYIVKQRFDHHSLLSTIRQIIDV